MPQFREFNTENKLRIPLSSFAAQTIENDCLIYSLKKTTLINTIIQNHYQNAECTISLQLKQYQEDLIKLLGDHKAKQNEALLKSILAGRAKLLTEKYAKRKPADVNLQITLNKRTKAFLTEDTYVHEELYYGNRPGHYVRALLEDYAQLPFYRREEIVFKKIFDAINLSIRDHLVVNVTTERGTHLSVKPYSIMTDPMSMYHYLIGVNLPSIESSNSDNSLYFNPPVISLRVSRLSDVEIQYYQSGRISNQEELQIKKELEEKTVQFVSGKSTFVKVWLSDNGIKNYEGQHHLRPSLVGKDPQDEHVYLFECTEAQIMFYFLRFGKDAKVLSPETLRNRFQQSYIEALDNYSN